MYFHLYSPYFLIPFIGILGLLFGSFATAIIYRIPNDISIVKPRSHCPVCKTKLKFLDLIPILSWIFNGGKCRYCKTKVKASYLLIEIIMFFMFLLSYFFAKTNIALLVIFCSLSFFVVILIAIDLKHYIIPDSINLGIFILGICYLFFVNAPILHYLLFPSIGLAVGLFLRWFMFVWKKQEGLGLGDVKFLAGATIFVGIDLFPIFLFLASIIAILTAIIKRERLFPFGPALAISLMLCVFYQQQNWFTIPFLYF